MAKVNCPTFGNDRERRPFNPNELTQLARRRAQWEHIVQSALSSDPAQRALQIEELTIAEARSIWIRNIAESISLNPQQVPRMQDLLVRHLGQLNRRLGLNPSTVFTTAGEVRYSLFQAKQVMEGLLNTAGRLVALEQVESFERVWRGHVRRLNLGRRRGERLMADVLDLANLPEVHSIVGRYTTETLGLQGNSRSLFDMFQRRRYQGLLNRLQGAGFTKPEIDELFTIAAEIPRAFDRVRLVARAAGVDVSRIENINYFSRQMTRDFQLRLQDTDVTELIQQVENGVTDFSTLHNRSRNTVHLIPEDMAILSRITGRTPDEITRMVLSSPREWASYLHTNLTTDQLDLLVDSGVLQKVPMSSTEVFDFFVSQYDMPYRYLSEMIRIDPQRALADYTSSLQRSAGNSAMLQRMISGDAIQNGWAVTGRQVREDARFVNFRPLSTSMDNWARQAKIPNAMQALGLNGDAYRQLSDIWVHPVVADQFEGLLAISTDPVNMAHVGRIIYSAQRFVNKNILSNIRYVANTALQGVRETFGAGGNLITYIPSLWTIQRTMMNGIEWADNVRGVYRLPDGNEYTFRQLLEYFFLTSGHGVAPGTNMIRIDSSIARMRVAEGLMNAPENLGLAFHRMMSYAAASGDPLNGRHIPLYERPGRAARQLAEGINWFNEAQFGIYAYTANIFDVTAKFNTFMTMVDNSKRGFSWNSVGAVLTTMQYRQFNSLDEITRQINEYNYNESNLGQLTSFANAYIKPFAGWAMVNPFMQIRHMLRNPHQFMAMQRLYSWFATPMLLDEDYNQDTVPDWVRGSGPIYLGRDSENHPIVMMPGGWDGGNDFLSWAVEGSNDVAREFFGRRVGTAEELREFDRSRAESFESWLLENTGSLNVIWRTAAETITGRDWTGRSFIPEDETDIQPTFFGMRLPPRIINVARKFPLLDTLDRMNIGGISGQAPVYDQQGRLIREERPTWTGAPQRRITSRSIDALGDNGLIIAMRLAGLNVRTIDYDHNAQTTLQDVEYTIQVLDRSINDAVVTYHSRDLSIEARQELEENIANRMLLWYQYRLDHARVLQWMRENDVLPVDALRELNTLRIRVRDLPMPAQETMDDISEDYIRRLRIINREPEQPED